MSVSSHVNLNEDGKAIDDVKKEVNKMNDPKVISSHTVIPYNKDFTVEDLNKWIESNVPAEIREKNKQIVKENMEALIKANETIAKIDELKLKQEVPVKEDVKKA
jgi:hypothetical protein